MCKLLEILGRAVTIDSADLIWQWLETVTSEQSSLQTAQYQQLKKVIHLVLNNRNPEQAEQQLKFYIFENPDCIYGRLAAAAVCLHGNYLEAAIEQLSSVYHRHPNNTMALYALGHCYERLGREAEAIEFYQDCLKFKNYLQLPRQRLAAIYFKNGQLKKTRTQYELLRNEYPDDISSLVILGYLYISERKFDLAVETFNNAILIQPDNLDDTEPGINELIGDGNLHQAIEHIEDLVQRQPDRTDLIVKQADILSSLGAAEQAVLHYQNAIFIQPNYLEASVKLGTQYLRMQQDYAAARQFNKSVEINDRIVEAYTGLAIAQQLAGSPATAMNTLSLAAAINGNSSLLFAEAASLQYKNNLSQNKPCHRLDDSINLTEAVIEAHNRQLAAQPGNPDLHYRLGMLLMSISKYHQALASFRNALKINPTFGPAQSKMLLCMLESGQKKQLTEYISRPRGLDKEIIQLHYRTALLYCNKVKFASSLLNLERHMQDNFAGSQTTINISVILQNLGLLDRASEAWDNLSETTRLAINADS